MSEWWLILLLVTLALLAALVFVYPLRRQPGFSVSLVPVIGLALGAGYYYWGGFPAWKNFIHQQKYQELAQEMLKSIKSPQELIDQLKAKLDDRPESAQGWYLLGRLYSSQNKLSNALESFSKAWQFKPDNEQFAVNYVHTLWQMNEQKFTPGIKELLNKLLTKNPDQPDALAMLAMDSFLNHAYKDAINYWQRLLKGVPQDSEEARALRKAIAKGYEKLGKEVTSSQ